MEAETSSQDRGPTDLLQRAVSSTRGLVVAEALIAIIVGFTADDLELLHVPGYILGLAVAFLALSIGSLLHGWSITRRLDEADEETVTQRLTAIRSRSRLAGVVAAVVFLGWLVLFSQGVPPWTI